MVSFSAALLLIVPAILSVLAYRYNLHAERQPQDWKVTADRIRLSDGRHIAYEIVGSRESENPIFWFHGLASSRYEASAPRLNVLKDLDAYTIGLDRPAVGQSDPHAGRSFQSFSADVAQVADKLGIKSFFVVGVSGGGPYALATAYYLPDRVRGVLLISPASDYRLLTPRQQDEWNDFHAATWLSKAVRAAVRFAPWTLKGLARVSETRIGGRALYNSVLKGLVSKIPNALADMDRKCLAAERPEHVTKTIPESQRQKTAAVLFQDVALFHTPWAFNVSQMNPDIRRATHIWQGTGDKQCPVVGAEALAAAIKGSHLYIEKDGGHFAYFGCNEANRRKALSSLINSGRSV